jgi:geranylgeranyl diphosphate synthase type I
MIVGLSPGSALRYCRRMRELVARVDAVLGGFLEERRGVVASLDERAVPLADEVKRLLDAGGKRIRPAFAIRGYVAAGGPEPAGDDAPILRIAAAFELLHTMAIVHDDLIEGAKERRGVPATAVWFADRASDLGASGDPEELGRAMAVLVGDVAAVWADLLFLRSGFAPELLASALGEYHAVRERMAVGQVLDVGGVAGDPGVARLRGGAYTVEGPLLIGAILAGGSEAVRASLGRYGEALGEAFQLLDDLVDGDAGPQVTRGTIAELIARAKAALDPELLDAPSIRDLEGLADLVAS